MYTLVKKVTICYFQIFDDSGSDVTPLPLHVPDPNQSKTKQSNLLGESSGGTVSSWYNISLTCAFLYPSLCLPVHGRERCRGSIPTPSYKIVLLYNFSFTYFTIGLSHCNSSSENAMSIVNTVLYST